VKKIIILTASLLLSASPSKADIVSLAGLQNITAPSTVGYNFLIGTPYKQVIFAEQQGYTLTSALATDTSVIPVGSVVDSWFVATNSDASTMTVADISATFTGAVLGLVYQSNALFEPSPNYALSNFLGASGTTYNLGPDCYTCGWETFQQNTNQFIEGLGFDYASYQGSTFNGYSVYGQAGEYTRIITEHVSPAPGPLAGAGLPGLVVLLGWLVGFLSLHRKPE
jgi:hypothetical protein